MCIIHTYDFHTASSALGSFSHVYQTTLNCFTNRCLMCTELKLKLYTHS